MQKGFANLLPIIVIFIILTGFVGFLSSKQPSPLPFPQRSSPSPTTPAGGQITITGKITCLPHRDKTGPQTLECAIGLQGNDGVYYGLMNLDKFIPSPAVYIGEQLTVSGILDTQTSPYHTKYDTVGTLFIESVEGVSSSTGTIVPEDPTTVGLAQVPDLPLPALLPNQPYSVQFFIEHRSALNGKTFRVRGQVKGALLGKDACPGSTKEGFGIEMCGRPTVTLEDSEKQDERYVLPVIVGEDEGYELYPIGGMVVISGTVDGSKLAVLMIAQK